MISKVWSGLLVVILSGLIWLSVSYLVSAYYLDRGIQSLSHQDDQAAIQYLEAALRFEPENISVHRWLAKAYLQGGNPDQTIQTAHQLLTLSPHNPLLELELGDIYDTIGDAEQAIVHYKTGLAGRQLPQLTVNYLKLSEQLWLKGDQAAAVSIWRDELLGRQDKYADLYAKWRLHKFYTTHPDQAEDYQEQANHFPQLSFLPSAEPRLAAYQLEAIAGVIQDKLWTRATKQNVLAYYAFYYKSSSAESLFRHLTQLIPDDPDLWYYLGEYYRRQGQSQPAELAYQKVLTLAPDYEFAYLRLGMLNEARFRQGDGEEWLDQAQKWYEQYHQQAPDDPLSLKKLADWCELSRCSKNIWLTQLQRYLTKHQPDFVANQEIDSKWSFVGYDVDETRLVRGEPSSLWLYWLRTANNSSSIAQNNVYHLGERTVQVIEEAQNIVPNSGFELGEAPFGFSNDIFAAASATRQFVDEVRHDQSTGAAELIKKTSFATDYFPVDQSELYLQAGWVKSEGGSGFMGRYWQGNRTEPTTPVIDQFRAEEWRHFSRLVKPTTGATGVMLLLINWESGGKVYFDNILFIKLGPPLRAN